MVFLTIAFHPSSLILCVVSILENYVTVLWMQIISYALNFRMLGTPDLLYAWNFRTAADRCGFSD